MNIKATPTEFELYSADGELVAKLSMFDEGCSAVEIRSVVSPDTWPELSAAILEALKQMHPEVEK